MSPISLTFYGLPCRCSTQQEFLWDIIIDIAQYLTTRVNKNILSIKIFVRSQQSISEHLLFVLQFQRNIFVAKICSFFRLLISLIFLTFQNLVNDNMFRKKRLIFRDVESELLIDPLAPCLTYNDIVHMSISAPDSLLISAHVAAQRRKRCLQA